MSEHTSGEQHDDARWEALARYLAGECSAEEADAIRRDLLDSPADAELLAALQEPRSNTRDDVDVESALRRVKARIAADHSGRTHSIPARRSFDSRPRTWRIPALAAAVVVIAVAATLIWRGNRPTHAAAPQLAQARTFSTPVGRRDSVLLADGSRVLLGPGTILTVSAGYGTSVREVAVTGEAYFDVRHDEAHPFVVRAGSARIRDVGTAFTVHDDGSGDVRVVVTTGAVRLQSAAASDSGVLLHGGDAGVVTNGAPAVARAGGATADDLAWTRGRLVFREAPLDDVAADLHRWYGIELRVPDSALARRHLTATFSGDSARHVVQVIALAIGGEANWHGDTAVIRR